METIDITFRALRGEQLLLDVQKQHLKRLQQQLMQIVGISTGGVEI